MFECNVLTKADNLQQRMPTYLLNNKYFNNLSYKLLDGYNLVE